MSEEENKLHRVSVTLDTATKQEIEDHAQRFENNFSMALRAIVREWKAAKAEQPELQAA